MLPRLENLLIQAPAQPQPRVHSHAGPFWPSCASPLNPSSTIPHPLLCLQDTGALESDILMFLFGKCPTPTLKAEYTYTLSCISQSRCQKTLLRYNAHWFRFRSWCQQKKHSFLPADPVHVAMFLSNSLRFALSRGLTYSTIKAASAAIFTAHNLAGLDDVTSHSFKRFVPAHRGHFPLEANSENLPCPLTSV